MTQPARRSHPRLALPVSVNAGIGLAFGAALVSGLAIYLNAFAVKQVPDAAVYTTLKNAVAAVVLIGVLAFGVRTRLVETPRVSRRDWPAILLVGVVGGSVPFVLFFTGLAQASAPSAAFIQKTLFVWVAILAAPILGERFGLATLLGLAVLLAGQLLVLPPSGIVWGTGETLILVATLLWAVETVVVRRLLRSVPTGLMATLRMAVGVVILFGYLAVTGKASSIAALGSQQWTWIGITGLILAAYVGTWFAALRRAPASVVTSVLVVGAVVTGLLTTATKGTVPSPVVVVGYVLIVAATALLAVSARSAVAALEDERGSGAARTTALGRG
jgi:drug/metabolite transporter (DMT)-like permease